MALVIRKAQMEELAGALPGPVVPCNLYIWVRMAVRDYFHRPYEDRQYVMDAAGKRYSGNTNRDGVAAVRLPRGTTSGSLAVWALDEEAEPVIWEVEIAEMEPASSKSGAVARLRSLEFLEADANVSDQSVYDEAVANFQAWAGLEATGQLDEKTAATLELACKPPLSSDLEQSSFPQNPDAEAMWEDWERMIETDAACEPEDEDE